MSFCTVQGWWDGGGGWDDNVHANAACIWCFSCCSVQRGFCASVASTVVFVGVVPKNPGSSRSKSVFLKQAALTVMRMVMVMMMMMMMMLLMLMIMMIMLPITMILVSMMITMLMLLLVHAQDKDGDDHNYDDDNNNDNVAPCCCCFAATCKTLPLHKSPCCGLSKQKP